VAKFTQEFFLAHSEVRWYPFAPLDGNPWTTGTWMTIPTTAVSAPHVHTTKAGVRGRGGWGNYPCARKAGVCVWGHEEADFGGVAPVATPTTVNSQRWPQYSSLLTHAGSRNRGSFTLEPLPLSRGKLLNPCIQLFHTSTLHEEEYEQ
jgi:hypothetical protein